MDLCEHKWFEEKLGEPCPWCRIAELERGRDIQKGNAERWEALAMQYKREIERLRAANKHYEYFAKTVKTQYEGQGFTGIDHALHTLRKALREDEDE